MYFLKFNVIAEPLINQWYASLRLVSPAMAAMIFANSHQKIMMSYIASPQMHEMACQHPETKGGPFIEYPIRKTDEIKKLLEETQKHAADFFIFAEDVKKLHELLSKHPKGMSLEPLYEKISDTLKGFIELYYDLANQPHFRFIEALLYKGYFNTSRLQQLVLSFAHEDHRSFMLSTPRLFDQNDYVLSKPFRTEAYDLLFASRTQGLDESKLEELCLALDIKSNDPRFLSFFTQQLIEKKYEPLAFDESVRIRYFGHACVLIETQKMSILFDPIISYEYMTDIPRFTYPDLPEKIDYVILSHAHEDHVLLEHLLQLRHKIGSIVVPNNVSGALQDPSLKLMLQDVGFQSIISLSEFEKINILDGFIQGLPFLGEHADLFIQSKLAYLVEIEGIKIGFMVDSNNVESKIYEKAHQVVGDIDILFIGMECKGAPLSWLYGPLMLTNITREMDQSRRLDGSNFEKAKKIVDIFHCKQVYIYAMGQEPWLNYISGIHYTPESLPIIESDKLIQYCQTKQVHAERLFGTHTIYL